MLRIRLVALIGLLALAMSATFATPRSSAQDGDDGPGVRRVTDWSFEKPSLQVGTRFDVTLPSMTDGQPVSLRQYRGKKLILHVFASW